MIVAGGKPSIVVVYEDGEGDMMQAIHRLIATAGPTVAVEPIFAGGYKNVGRLCQRKANEVPSPIAVIGVVDVDKIHRLDATLSDGDGLSERLTRFLRRGIANAERIHGVALRWNAETVVMAAIEAMPARVKDSDRFFAACPPDLSMTFCRCV
jgi:hypothetical protein